MNEKPIVLEGVASPLIGMLHPASGKQETGVLMMVAGGPQYRIGGHRQLVLWARKFSSQGFPVMRFDFSGMGDSYGEYVEFITQARSNMNNDGRLAIPTEDHYWPLLYVEGVRHASDKLTWIYEGFEYGSISLRSYMLS